MITLVDVVRAVSVRLEELFGKPPITKDLREPVPRPSTYVTPLDLRRDREGALIHDSIQLGLVRFGTESYRGYLELLRDEAKLSRALDEVIRVAEQFHLEPEDVSLDLVREDMAVYAEFTVQLWQLPDEDAGTEEEDLMETLVLSEKE